VADTGFPVGCLNLTLAVVGTYEPKVSFLARPRTHTAGHERSSLNGKSRRSTFELSGWQKHSFYHPLERVVMPGKKLDRDRFSATAAYAQLLVDVARGIYSPKSSLYE